MSYCPNCGEKVVDGARFCPSCGSSLTDSAASAQEPPIPQGIDVGVPRQTPSEQDQSLYSGVPVPPYQATAAQDPDATPRAPYGYEQDVYGQRQQGPARSRQHQGAQTYASQEEHPEYKTLGGWLLFFVVAWGIGALSDLVEAVKAAGALVSVARYASGLVLPTLLGTVGLVAAAAANILMVVLIVRRRHTFLRVYQIVSIACAALSLLTSIAVAFAAPRYAGSLPGSLDGSFVGQALGLCLMTLYFCKSKRVEAYMGSTDYLRNALFTLGV